MSEVFYQSLEIMGKGMLGVFAVLGLLAVIVYLLSKLLSD